MRYPSVFVRDVTVEERRHLKAGLRAADAWRVRRCQILLASEYGAGVPRIARQMGCSEQTVRNTIHAFNTPGRACLQRVSSRPHTTRERLGSAAAQQLQALLHQSPRTFGHPPTLWTFALPAHHSFSPLLHPPPLHPPP